MISTTNRRRFIKSLGLISAGVGAGPFLLNTFANTNCKSVKNAIPPSMANLSTGDLFFKISLAQWSLHKTLFDGKMTNLDFPQKAKNDFGIAAVEYVNVFFKDKARDQNYLSELKKRCDDNGVKSVLIMCDGEGSLGDLDKKLRNEAVENHHKWVEAAHFLDCHSIRVNARGTGSREEIAKTAAEGLHDLSLYAQQFGLNVIVENHGGYSSNGKWLTEVIKSTGMPNCGTLPDFNNFCIQREKEGDWTSPCAESYDRYTGTKEMMPFARGVSGKTVDFDAQGNCIETDYYKMLPIIKAAGYTGHIGIEYEGDILSEEAGISATKALLEKVGAAI